MTKRIKLSQNLYTVVDNQDYDKLAQYGWYASDHGNHKLFYAVRRTPVFVPVYRQLTVFMHRAIMNAPKGLQVDHIDGDGLNNTRANLRLATAKQNSQNNGKASGKSSSYKGVSIHNQTGRWQVYITVNYKNIFVGIFADELEAARAYDQAAKKHFGEFARLNFPPRK